MNDNNESDMIMKLLVINLVFFYQEKVFENIEPFTE